MYPIIDATIKQCILINNSVEVSARVRSFLEEYFADVVAHTRIYFSQEFGAAFPYTVIRLSEIAERLHRKLGSPFIADIDQDHFTLEDVGTRNTQRFRDRPHKEFVFGTVFSIASGHPYHWVEHGIDQIAKRIPEALRALMRAEEPKDFEVYGIGSPAGELGSLSDKFLRLEEQPFKHLGRLYAEFINSLQQSELEELPAANLLLWGVSMGASIAAFTAHTLIANKQASQSFDATAGTHKPLVRVIMQVPVGTSTGRFRRWQIPVGFLVDIFYQTLTSTYGREVGAAEQKFIAIIYRQLLYRGIAPQISAEEICMKKRLIDKLLVELRMGVPIPKGLKTNEVIGIHDFLMYAWEFQKKANSQRDRAAGSLGANIFPILEGGRRRFAINMTHTPAVVRENYFKRLIKVAETMHELSARSHHE